MAGLLGRKIGMTQLFDESGEAVPVTVLQVGPCVVVQRKSLDSDGYEAVQIGFEELKESRAAKKGKAYTQHFIKKSVKPQRFLKEFPVAKDEAYEIGQMLKVDLFQVGDQIKVTGLSKGKGYQGVMKRHGKAGGPASHGSRFHRTTGSIGQRTSPGEVFKNMKLPGHLGYDRVTEKNLKVVQIRPEENLLLVSGAVPGPKENLIFVRKM